MGTRVQTSTVQSLPMNDLAEFAEALQQVGVVRSRMNSTLLHRRFREGVVDTDACRSYREPHLRPTLGEPPGAAVRISCGWTVRSSVAGRPGAPLAGRRTPCKPCCSPPARTDRMRARPCRTAARCRSATTSRGCFSMRDPHRFQAALNTSLLGK